MGNLIKSLTVFVFIAVAFSLISCNDKVTEPPQSSNEFNGIVKDESGNPVSGVSVYLIYDDAPVNNKAAFNYYPKTVLDTLPVELTTFSALASGRNIQLRWSTATEINVSGFSIERRQNDTSASWDKIGFVQGSGNSNSLKSYSYTDAGLVAGNRYFYRLKMVQMDGSFSYSGIVEATTSLPLANNLTTCYPNPFANNSTTIGFFLSDICKISLKILDYKKSVVKRTLIDDFANNNSSHQPGNYVNYLKDTSKTTLGNGIYIVQLIMLSETFSKYDTLERKMCKLNTDISLIQNSETISVSAADGKFIIPYNKFYIGVQYVFTGPDSPDPLGTGNFTNTPTLVLVKDGYQPLQKKLTVDNSSNPETAFVLKQTK